MFSKSYLAVLLAAVSVNAARQQSASGDAGGQSSLDSNPAGTGAPIGTVPLPGASNPAGGVPGGSGAASGDAPGATGAPRGGAGSSGSVLPPFPVIASSANSGQSTGGAPGGMASSPAGTSDASSPSDSNGAASGLTPFSLSAASVTSLAGVVGSALLGAVITI